MGRALNKVNIFIQLLQNHKLHHYYVQINGIIRFSDLTNLGFDTKTGVKDEKMAELWPKICFLAAILDFLYFRWKQSEFFTF